MIRPKAATTIGAFQIMLTVAAHPLLDLRAFTSEFPSPIGEMKSPDQLLKLLSLDFPAPVVFNESIKPKVRDLLRFGGYKPTGRGKPASEYLRQTVEKVGVPSINLAVDACNVVSLHSGLPISVVDVDLAKPPLQISIASGDSEYVFNAAGQTIKLDGLLCLIDAEGPCANAVKDSQRTKTSASTTRTLSIVWGTRELLDHSEETAAWYRRILENAGVKTTSVTVLPIP